MTSFQTLVAEIRALRTQIFLQLPNATSFEEAQSLVEPLFEKLNELHQSAPDDVKQKIEEDMKDVFQIRQRTRFTVAMARLYKIMHALVLKKEYVSADSIKEIKAALQNVEPLIDLCNDDDKEHVKVARETVEVLEKNPALLLCVRLKESVERIKYQSDIEIAGALLSLKTDVQELDVYGKDLPELDKRALEEARAMVKEIEELPEDQRATLEVYREFLTMRRCASLLAQNRDDVIRSIILLARLHMCLAELDKFGNKTAAQESEILAAKEMYSQF